MDNGYGAKTVVPAQLPAIKEPGKPKKPKYVYMYTPELGHIICDLIVSKWRLSDFDRPAMRTEWEVENEMPPGTLPCRTTLFKWVYSPGLAPGFPELYRAAHEMWVHRLVAESIDIADEDREDMVAVQAAKNRISARQWAASRILRAEYGDRVDGNIVHTHELGSKTTDELMAQLLYLRAQTPELEAITVEATTVSAA
jgi:hypothetical protein